MNLEPGAPVIVHSRKFVVEECPVQIATSYLPADLVRDTAITQPNTGPGGSYARLAELGAEPVLFSEELRARMLSEEERTALALAAGTPVLEICRTAFTGDERPGEVNQMLLDAGSYVLEYRLSIWLLQESQPHQAPVVAALLLAVAARRPPKRQAHRSMRSEHVVAGAIGSTVLGQPLSKVMAPTSCFNGQVHRLPDAPEAYGDVITPPKAAPAQSRSVDCVVQWPATGISIGP